MSQPIAELSFIGRLRAWFSRILRIGRLEFNLRQTDLELQKQVDQHQARFEAQQAALDALQATMSSYRGELNHAMASQRNEWKATLARDSRALERAAHALAAGFAPQLLAPPALGSSDTYLQFEDAFRGRWKVEERVRWYIPYVSDVYKQSATLKPCLDIGCGRGEWMLELKRNGFPVVGVDLNPAMADAARAQGLEVIVADAVAHLRALDPSSVSVISAFHLIEHIPFELVLHLIEAAHRALIPGGLLILETPNPENLAVGGCTFWYDPTHLRPLPPAMLKFFVEHAGYQSVRTARFYLRQPGPDHVTLDEPVLPSVDGPLDYGILARKV